MGDLSVSLCMPLAPFKVLPQCWSPEGVSLSKSTCGALQEEMPENPTVSSADPTPTGFYSQKLWGLIFLALRPWAGWSGLELGPLATKVTLPIFSHHV